MKYQEIRDFLRERKASTTKRMVVALRELFPDLCVDGENFNAHVYTKYGQNPIGLFHVYGRRSYGSVYYSIMSDKSLPSHNIDDTDADLKRASRVKARWEAEDASPFVVDNWGAKPQTRTMSELKAKLESRRLALEELKEGPIPWEAAYSVKALYGKADNKEAFLKGLDTLRDEVLLLISQREAVRRAVFANRCEAVRGYLRDRKSKSIF